MNLIFLILLLVLCLPSTVLADTTTPNPSTISNKSSTKNNLYEAEREIAELDQAIKSNPQDAEAYYKRCLAYYDLGKYDKAREDAYRAELEGKIISLAFIKRLQELNKELSQRRNSALAQSLKFSLAREGLSVKDLDDITRNYYKKPHPDKLAIVVRAMLLDSWFIYDIASFEPFAHFVATVAHNNQEFLVSLKSQVNNYSGKQKDAFNKIIYASENFRSPEPISPQGLDYLWAEFFATGTAEPVKKIMSTLNNQNGDLQMTKYSAQWSLRANARSDKTVYKIIKNALATAQGGMKEELEKILRK